MNRYEGSLELHKIMLVCGLATLAFVGSAQAQEPTAPSDAASSTASESAEPVASDPAANEAVPAAGTTAESVGMPAQGAMPEPAAAPAPTSTLPAATSADNTVSYAPVDTEVPQGPPQRRARRNPWVMVAGLATFGISYLTTALVGAQLESGSATPTGAICTNCDQGHLLYVPIAGPWMFLSHADGDDGKAASAALGILQAAGAVLSIAGIIVFANSGASSSTAAAAAPSLAFAAIPTSGGAYGTVSAQW